jgi:hypothetical protein
MEGEHLVSVPASWTDLVPEEPLVHLAAGRSPFRVVDLMELAELVGRVRSASVKGITP